MRVADGDGVCVGWWIVMRGDDGVCGGLTDCNVITM